MEQKLVLEAKDIKKSFAKVNVLRGINIKFYAGECHALIGENGAGKSTLMKILSGAYSKDSGEILLEGEKVEFHNPLEAREKGISIIYQELSLIPTLSAGENVFLGRLPGKYGHVDWKSIYEEARRYFKEVDLDIDPKIITKKLTVAQQQQIEISRALSLKSKVVILDEPTSSLTDKEIACLFELIRRLKHQGIAIIYISHKLDEVLTICDRVTALKDGEMSGAKLISEVTKADMVNMMVGRSLDQYYPEKMKKPDEEVMFEVRNLNVGHSVKDVSFQVHKGEIVGFAGLVGAGRSETMRAIFGADKLESGEIYLNGKKLNIKSPQDAIRNKIAFVTEDRRNEGLVMTMSVRMNTTLASLGLYSNRFGMLNQSRERKDAQKYIEKMKTRTAGMEQRVVNLSGGNQQKVVFSKWLNTGAEVYIFDEPTRGIDVGAKAEIYQLIVNLAESGKAIMVVSSELPEVMGISDRIIVMQGGKIVGSIDKEEYTENRIMTLAVGGDES